MGDTSIFGTGPATINPLLFGFEPGTAYRYRLVVQNADGPIVSPTKDLETFATAAFSLPDERAWELVSPVEKNGGQVERPGALAGGGVLQAAANGQAVTYGSAASFADGAGGAPPASQYVSLRGAEDWSTLNITPATVSGSYGTGPDGVPYQIFSPDLSRGLMLNGRPCRGEGSGCPVANPPLAGTDAPTGYQNYYVRDGSTGGFEALLGPTEIAETGIDPSEFELRLVGATPSLGLIVLSTCAALTPDAIEVPLGEGCDPQKPNIYLWSEGSLTLINDTPGAELGAQAGAISDSGSRIYWTDLSTGNLFVREGLVSKQVDAEAGGGGTFQTATPDGAVAFYTKEGHLWRYAVSTGSSTDLTPAGGVLGVLGASADASRVYYATDAGVFLRDGQATTKIADAADAANYPPAIGTARVTADGTVLVFVSTVPLQTSDGTTYDNISLNDDAPTRQVYRFEATGSGRLTCVSCNPSHGRPLGPSAIPGALANGASLDAFQAYKPRVVAANGKRVFFDSRDALSLSDVNVDWDVYQWEAQGVGSCKRAGGCVELISSGLAERAFFIDASTSGDDVFFVTDRSLVPRDPGSTDLYDARVGGGIPEPDEPDPCIGDACQDVPPRVEDPTLTTVLRGPGNPAEFYRRIGRPVRKRCAKGKRLKTVRTKKGQKVRRCVKRKRPARARHRSRGRRGGH